MAASLLRAGHAVRGYDVDPVRLAGVVGQGVTAANGPCDASAGVEALVISVVNADQTEAVLFGEGGAIEGMAPDSVVLATSTVPRDFIVNLAARIRERDVWLIDAPVSGGMAKAGEGELTVISSGPQEAYRRAQPVLDAIAERVYRVSETIGDGSSVKMINQLLAGVHIAVACEAIGLGIRAGLDPKLLYEIISNSAGSSWMFVNRIPQILENDYAPASATSIFVKDLGIVLDTGDKLQYPLPMSMAAHTLFLAAAALGFGADSDASVIKVFASLTGIELPGSA